jgi:ABC-type antimicrobial peptide transport system permease subunit
MILKEAGRVTLAGILIGLVGAVVAAMLMRSLLFDVKSWDVPTLAAVAIGLGSAALLASYIPARRAARVDPIVALRCE